MDLGRLLVVDWVDEIDEIRFWADSELSDALPPRLLTRIANALRANGNDAYLEHRAAASNRAPVPRA